MYKYYFLILLLVIHMNLNQCFMEDEDSMTSDVNLPPPVNTNYLNMYFITHGLEKKNATPDYSKYYFIHYYHHYGHRVLRKHKHIKSRNVKKCDHITFCPPNTTALCTKNNFIYCVSPKNDAKSCQHIELGCIDSTLTIPCENKAKCNSTKHATIPCVMTLDFVKINTRFSERNIAYDASSINTYDVYCVTVIAMPHTVHLSSGNDKILLNSIYILYSILIFYQYS